VLFDIRVHATLLSAAVRIHTTLNRFKASLEEAMGFDYVAPVQMCRDTAQSG